MKLTIESAQPDGVLVTFKSAFYFDTLYDAYAFVNTVDKLYREETNAFLEEVRKEVNKSPPKSLVNDGKNLNEETKE